MSSPFGSDAYPDANAQPIVISLTAAQLRKAATTPVELLPAPGAGKAYVPFPAFYIFVFFAGANEFAVSETPVGQAGQIQYDTLVGTFTVGETITGGTSGATAVIDADDGVEVIDFTQTTGDFVIGETITGGTSAATANTVDVQGGGVVNEPTNPVGIATIRYGSNDAKRFVTEPIEHPTYLVGNTNKLKRGEGNTNFNSHTLAEMENQPITFSCDSDWTDGTDVDANGDGTAKIHLFYKLIDV